MRARLKRWTDVAKRDLYAVWLAAGDPRVPRAAKLLAIVTAAYALSPIDLIPDFIPVIGYLDDVVLVPLGILLVVRMIPADVMADLRAEAERRMATPLPRNRAAGFAVAAVWIAVLLALGWWVAGLIDAV